ncbi:copper-binding protein [Dyella sp. RRB7]|uniref:copper-binding protein n=1 Tax=Dyella sp. RRB7 TaxID=2919502 RepID=UPI001FA95D1E|nr:copper-binding protein [Dyella sp. RRB7]
MKRSLIALACTTLFSIGTTWAAPNDAVVTLPAVEVNAFSLEQHQASLHTTITQVDPAKRTITLKGPGGHEETVEVGSNAGSLKDLKVGDQVDTHYQRDVALQILPADGYDQPGIEYSGSMAASNSANDPTIHSSYTETLTTTLSAISLDHETLTLTAADGHSRTIDVRKLEDRNKLSKLKVGDLVRVTYAEAMAISLQPKEDG